MRDLVPESQAYMDLVAFEQKLDATIMRKRLEIQETIRRPMKRKRKLRVFISHQFLSPEPDKTEVLLIVSVCLGAEIIQSMFVGGYISVGAEGGGEALG